MRRIGSRSTSCWASCCGRSPSRAVSTRRTSCSPPTSWTERRRRRWAERRRSWPRGSGCALAQGRQAEAVADADELLRRLERRGHRGLRLRMPVAEALLATGDVGEARRLAAEEVERAASYGAPSALGVGQRMLGLTSGGDGLQHLELAVDTLERTPCRLEHAKALAAFGAALRRANQRTRAREPLRQALELAHRAGAAAPRRPRARGAARYGGATATARAQRARQPHALQSSAWPSSSHRA